MSRDVAGAESLPSRSASASESFDRPADGCLGVIDDIGCQSSGIAISSDTLDNFAAEAKPDSSLPKLEAEHITFNDAPLSFLNVLHAVLQLQEVTHVGLSQFLRLSVQPPSRRVHTTASSRDLFPCPVPLWRWTGPSQLSPKRRRRRRYLANRAKLLQKIIGVLNWETLGHPVKPPVNACAGAPFTEDQLQMITRLDHFMQASDMTAQSLGRCSEKFAAMLQVCQELLGCDVQDVDLLEFAEQIASDLDTYGNRRGCSGNSHKCSSSTPDVNHNGGQQARTNLSASPAKPVVASRIKWEHAPSFDPIPFFTDSIAKQGQVAFSSVG